MYKTIQHQMQIRQQRRPKTFWFAPESSVTSSPSPLCETLTTFNTEGYSTMRNDKFRNAKYNQAIIDTSNNGVRSWLEVGCGPDLVLTKMVLDANPQNHITAIEVNTNAVKRAKLHARHDNYTKRLTILEGFSQSYEIKEVLRKHTFDTVVHELLGFFAGSEGVASVLTDLFNTIGVCATIPYKASTYFSPVYMSLDHVPRQAYDVYYAENTFVLLRNFPTDAAISASGGTGAQWTTPGVIEELRFQNTHYLATVQEHVNTFISDTNARVNGLSCWMWCETNPGNEFTSRGNTRDRATSWRNVVIVLSSVLDVPSQSKFVVSVTADLQTTTPSYKFDISLDDVLVDSKSIRNFYPTFSSTR